MRQTAANSVNSHNHHASSSAAGVRHVIVLQAKRCHNLLLTGHKMQLSKYWVKQLLLLQVSYRVTHVVLSARQDCCRCPLAGAKIYIGDPSALNLASNENPDLSTESNWQLCATVRAVCVCSVQQAKYIQI